jgi:hypothetical protein
LNATRNVWKAHMPEVAADIANKLRNIPEFKSLYMEMRGG